MWKDIIGWEKYYEINECGNVRNKITGKFIVGDINNEGYERVCLYNKNNMPPKQRFFRHRLVALMFIDNPNNYPEVNHKDANIHNNNIWNLEWCDKEYNENHSHKFGNKTYRPFVVKFKNDITKTYDSKPKLAKELNVSRSLIRLWLNKTSQTYNKYNIENIEYI